MWLEKSGSPVALKYSLRECLYVSMSILRLYVSMCLCLCLRLCVCMHTCLYVCTSISRNIYVYVYVDVCICIYLIGRAFCEEHVLSLVWPISRGARILGGPLWALTPSFTHSRICTIFVFCCCMLLLVYCG